METRKAKGVEFVVQLCLTVDPAATRLSVYNSQQNFQVRGNNCDFKLL